ncbi:TM2 domain-containing protein [Algibacter sp. Ld11]|uniref:TM2 domain-containing protein n=1 Tax=Algibacter sp. Ld11 TaxID=649150 RepID=UPI0038676EBB
MSNEKNLGDDLNDMLGDAKDGAQKAAGEAKEAASEFTKGATEVLGAENKKIVAGIVAILIGSLGIHKFILGYTKEGIIQIVATFVTCGIAGIIPFIEGIIYLTKSDEEFYNTYQVGKKGWF